MKTPKQIVELLQSLNADDMLWLLFYRNSGDFKAFKDILLKLNDSLKQAPLFQRLEETLNSGKKLETLRADEIEYVYEEWDQIFNLLSLLAEASKLSMLLYSRHVAELPDVRETLELKYSKETLNGKQEKQIPDNIVLT